MKEDLIIKNVVSITLNSLPLSIKHTQPSTDLAGAGKTTTITAKIDYMIKKENIYPSRILALTFSKEAARHMKTNAVSSIRAWSDCDIVQLPDINI